MICDNCSSDITDYLGFRNRTEALRYFKKEYNKPFTRGKQFCEECENPDKIEVKHNTEDILDSFKNSKYVSITELKNHKS